MTVIYCYFIEYRLTRRSLYLKCPMYYLDYDACYSDMMDLVKHLLSFGYEVLNYRTESILADISHPSFKNKIVSPF